MNNQLSEGALPVLRGLMRKVKETNQADKASYYKLQKELQALQMDRHNMQNIALICTRRIEKLEATFGIDAPPLPSQRCQPSNMLTLPQPDQ